MIRNSIGGGNSSAQRIEYIDIMRGFAIFLVTLGHVLEHSGYPDSKLFAFIYSFHMPLFMCISGFVSIYSCQKVLNSEMSMIQALRHGVKYIWKKFRFIMVPYFAWSLIVRPFFFCTYTEELNLMGQIKATCIDNVSFWFLPCLFGLSLFIPVLLVSLQVIKRKWISEIVATIGYCLIIVLLQKFTHLDFFRSIISYIIPFMIGCFMARYKKYYNLIVDNSFVFFLSFIVFCMIEGLFYSHSGMVGKLVRLACGILSLPIMFNVFKHLDLPDKIANIIAYVGRNTLPIYVMQFLILGNMLLIEGLNLFYQIVIFSVVSVLMIGVILLLTEFFKKNAILRQVFLGQK